MTVSNNNESYCSKKNKAKVTDLFDSFPYACERNMNLQSTNTYFYEADAWLAARSWLISYDPHSQISLSLFSFIVHLSPIKSSQSTVQISKARKVFIYRICDLCSKRINLLYNTICQKAFKLINQRKHIIKQV